MGKALKTLREMLGNADTFIIVLSFCGHFFLVKHPLRVVFAD